MLEQAGVRLGIGFSPYNQVFQELLSSTSQLINNVAGINVVLIRIEDFVRDSANEEVAFATIARVANELSEAFATFAACARAPTIVAIFPPSPSARRFRSGIDAANAQLNSQIQSLPGIIPLPTQDIDNESEDAKYDSVSDELAHVPFSPNYYASLALAIARKTHSALVPVHKVLVLDCDNTLWRGIVGEDGVDEVKITPGFAKLQNFAIKAHSEGALICLVSKNNERDVLEVFERRSDMLLTLDLIVAHRINWENKAQNIASLAQELSLGLDSFVFLDDNPVECAFVRTELPEVITLQVPAEAEMESFLANIWTFDKVTVTDEDQRRTQMYKEEAARQASEIRAVDIGEFVASLKVQVDIRPPSDAEWPRLAQLTQRTNQFNFTTKRRTQPELRAMADAGATILSVHVEDRFGDYGLVGLIVATIKEEQFYVDTFLLSCRVLGRGVEHTILRELGKVASDRDLSIVAIPLSPTSKNEPARAFIESVASQFYMSLGKNCIYLIPAVDATKIAHRPGFDPDAVIQASRRPTADMVSPKAPSAARSDRYTQLARQLTSGRAVNAAINFKALRPRNLPNEATPPTDEVERQMLALWEELLRLAGLGIDDDYFALGGTSLVAARLFAEITRQFGVKLPLTTILSSPTVRKLAQHIGVASADSGSLIRLKDGPSRNLFLIHDGDGETLLYANIAARLPADFAVFGVNPRKAQNVPLAHTQVEDMASYYIGQIRQRQPQRPLFAWRNVCRWRHCL